MHSKLPPIWKRERQKRFTLSGALGGWWEMEGRVAQPSPLSFEEGRCWEIGYGVVTSLCGRRDTLSVPS